MIIARNLPRKLLREWCLFRNQLLKSTAGPIYLTGSIAFLALGVVLFTLRYSPLGLFAFNVILFLVCTCFVAGIIYEIVQQMAVVWDKPVGKIIVSFLTATSGPVSLILASQTINLFIPRYDPSHFPIAIATLALLFSPVIWILIIIPFLLLVFMGSYLRAMLIGFEDVHLGFITWIRNRRLYRLIFRKRRTAIHQPLKKSALMGKTALWFARAASAWILLFLIFTHVLIPQNNKIITTDISTLIAYTGYYTFSLCQNQNFTAGERVAFIDADQISVAVPVPGQGYTFTTRSCLPFS